MDILDYYSLVNMSGKYENHCMSADNCFWTFYSCNNVPVGLRYFNMQICRIFIPPSDINTSENPI